MIARIQKKFRVLVPDNLTVLYFEKKNLITFISLLNNNNKKSLKLNIKIRLKLLKNKKTIEVSPLPVRKVSTKEKKVLKAKQGTLVSTFKYLIVQLTLSFFCERMRFIGVGYRAFPLFFFKKKNRNKSLHVRLGYSHDLYFRVLDELTIYSFKFTRIYIIGDSYPIVTQIAAILRSCRLPDPYKGKGVLYENEKVALKIGKRV